MPALLHPSSFILPPSERDFEIHRLSEIELLSTRKIAAHFKISQTRVRQIVEEVSRWLAEKLPVATDLDLERQKRLALHLAAAQLRHQIEILQELWTDSKDTKYLRQQTRCILALARLGIIPGTLDALAAEAEAEYKPEAQARDSIPKRPAAAAFSLTPDYCPLTPSSSSSSSSPPPSEDCSPNTSPNPTAAAEPSPSPAPTPSLSTSSDEDFIPDDANLDDLNLIEQHLLTTLSRTPLDKPKNRDILNRSLAELRHKRACLQLQISPNTPGIANVLPNPSILDRLSITQNA